MILVVNCREYGVPLSMSCYAGAINASGDGTWQMDI
jgi:hypothetical protein